MMGKPNLTSKPPEPRTRDALEEARVRFISGGGEDIGDPEAIKKDIYPWEAPFVRADVKKLFSLRLSEPDMLKLQYIHQQTGKSMHQFCVEVLLPAIEAEIRRLTGGS